MTKPYASGCVRNICCDASALSGAAFDPSAAPPPDLAIPLHQRDPGGLGIHLMRQMTDRVEYRRTDGHNRLRIETVRR